MFTNMGLHVLHNPAGTFSYVGSIPAALGKKVKPTRSDIMGQRWFKDEAGEAYAIKFPVFETRELAVEHAEGLGFSVVAEN